MKEAQSHADFEAHLREQLAFSDASAAAYDAGFEGEAKRLAVVLRILLHDTKHSHSLLESLGLKNALQFWDVVGTGPSEGALAFVGLRMGFTAQGLKYYPKLHEPRRRIGFEPWWEGIILIQGAPVGTIRRKDAVLVLANTDGGAHVDPALDAAYKALSRDVTFGWTVSVGGAPGIVENSPILPAVRQIAHEVGQTLREQVPEMLDTPAGKSGFRSSAT
jgi:hypothetical protein